MWHRPLLFIFLAVTAYSALALDRFFPPGAKRGKMSPGIYPEIVINSKVRHLSAGARIWNQNNLIEMPAYLQGSNLVVNYTENMQGDIDRVWILTEEEASQPPPK